MRPSRGTSRPRSEIGVELREEGEEQWVEADHDRLLQVASNLIENALRETPPEGSVVVSVRPGVLAVADTGPGIAEADQAHAFDRFYLYDKFGRDRPVGSGLGLAIVKQLATAMGGDVRVESPPRPARRSSSSCRRSRPQLRGVDDLEIGAVQGT